MKSWIALFLLTCAGCAVAPAPAWKSDAHDALEGFAAAYLAGDSRSAQHYLDAARSAVTGTGRADLVARVELYRCAIGTAALDYEACKGVDAWRDDLVPEDRAYALFLEGALDASGAVGLPDRYRQVAAARDDQARLQRLQEIEDPVSRLVASGALFRGGELPPAGISVAVDTASGQAWRRPLLAWLNVQLVLAQEKGDAAAADAIRRRIDIAGGSKP